MKYAKINQINVTNKVTGSSYIKLEMRSGKRGRGKVLFHKMVFNSVVKSHALLYELNGQVFCHSALTLGLRDCYKFAIENRIKLL